MARSTSTGPGAREKARMLACMAFERDARAQGFVRVAGVDEAGRGPLAGPVVAAAVVLSEPIPGLDDSKRLSTGQREALFDVLHSGGHAIGVHCVAPADVDLLGIQQANYLAMARAAAALAPPPDLLLIDGFNVPGVSTVQWRIIKGDQRSLSIAAASIVAKVTRDRLMDQLDEEYPQYLFRKHKGYGTAAHLALLAEHGPCPAHRMSFAPLAQKSVTCPLFEVEEKA
jgi:ribonuclease HII